LLRFHAQHSTGTAQFQQLQPTQAATSDSKQQKWECTWLLTHLSLPAWMCITAAAGAAVEEDAAARVALAAAALVGLNAAAPVVLAAA
jgi:hypothetical protein